MHRTKLLFGLSGDSIHLKAVTKEGDPVELTEAGAKKTRRGYFRGLWRSWKKLEVWSSIFGIKSDLTPNKRISRDESKR